MNILLDSSLLLIYVNITNYKYNRSKEYIVCIIGRNNYFLTIDRFIGVTVQLKGHLTKTNRNNVGRKNDITSGICIDLCEYMYFYTNGLNKRWAKEKTEKKGGRKVERRKPFSFIEESLRKI